MPSYLENLKKPQLALVEAAADSVETVIKGVYQINADKGVSFGDIKQEVEEHSSSDRMTTGMGLLPTALDLLEERGTVECIESPVSPVDNGNVIGRYDWSSVTYRLGPKA